MNKTTFFAFSVQILMIGVFVMLALDRTDLAIVLLVLQLIALVAQIYFGYRDR